MPRKVYHRTSSGWTDERRARHSAAIRTWSPWVSSTGPRTDAGKAISRCNALTHGATSRPAKDFMRNFRTYRKFLQLCWKKREALVQQQKNLQNELLNKCSYSTHHPARHSGESRNPPTLTSLASPESVFNTPPPINLCKQFAFSLTYAYIAHHEYAP